MMYRAGAHESDVSKIKGLIAEGLTNYQIAQRTGVHPRAIEAIRSPAEGSK